MVDHNDQTEPLAPGWWRTKAGWKAAGNRPATEGGWLFLAFGVVIAAVMLLVGGWRMWSAAAFTVLASSVGILPKRVVIGLWVVLALTVMVALY